MNDFLDHAGVIPANHEEAKLFDLRIHAAGDAIPYPFRGIVTVRRKLGIPAKLWLGYRRGLFPIPASVWAALDELEASLKLPNREEVVA